jgi:hypothetical protein
MDACYLYAEISDNSLEPLTRSGGHDQVHSKTNHHHAVAVLQLTQSLLHFGVDPRIIMVIAMYFEFEDSFHIIFHLLRLIELREMTTVH